MDSSLLVEAFQRNIAFGVTRPLKNTSEASSVSDVALSVLIEKEAFWVPEIVVEPADRVLALMLFTYSSR